MSYFFCVRGSYSFNLQVAIAIFALFKKNLSMLGKSFQDYFISLTEYSLGKMKNNKIITKNIFASI